jgi:hypothetical protein
MKTSETLEDESTLTTEEWKAEQQLALGESADTVPVNEFIIVSQTVRNIICEQAKQHR